MKGSSYPNWCAVKVPTYPKEWKVIPRGLPAWENNSPDNYFLTQQEAQAESDKRNNQWKKENNIPA